MNKYILFLLLSMISLGVFGQTGNIIGGGGILHTTSDPDFISIAQKQDLRSESGFALDTLGNKLYKYVTGRTLGDRWDEVFSTDNQNLSLSGDTLFIERGNFVLISDLTGGAPARADIDRQVLRVPKVGDVLGPPTSTYTDWANWHYFAPPTISLTQDPNTRIFERGTQNSIAYLSVTSNPGGSTLSNGIIKINGSSVTTFGSSNVGSYNMAFNPGGVSGFTGMEYITQSAQDYSGNGENGTVNSNSISLYGVYPVFYGMSSTDIFANGGDIYTLFNKDISREGDKSYLIHGSGYIYFAVPTYWNDEIVESIFDTNDFEQTGSFENKLITVASSGLVNNWTHQYRVYKLKTITVIKEENAATYKLKF